MLVQCLWYDDTSTVFTHLPCSLSITLFVSPSHKQASKQALHPMSRSIRCPRALPAICSDTTSSSPPAPYSLPSVVSTVVGVPAVWPHPLAVDLAIRPVSACMVMNNRHGPPLCCPLPATFVFPLHEPHTPLFIPLLTSYLPSSRLLASPLRLPSPLPPSPCHLYLPAGITAAQRVSGPARLPWWRLQQ